MSGDTLREPAISAGIGLLIGLAIVAGMKLSVRLNTGDWSGRNSAPGLVGLFAGALAVLLVVRA